jgi:glycosyltransferase involved in cell wall biosynthesis
VGGGARSSQLAFELLRQGFHVAVVHFAEAVESVDLGLRFIHPRLEQYRADRFDYGAFIPRAEEKALAIVEAPFGSLVAPARRLQPAGWPLAYDIIDDWTDPALGGGWYHPKLERELITKADMVLASASDLVNRAHTMGREAILVPNAVNDGIFGVELAPHPPDLPDAEMIIGYHGSLYGNWFDWTSLHRIAEAFPNSAVVVIGDDRLPRPEMPGNVRFLGLKPQRELPGYLQRFDVGVIPFQITETTHAVSPLKAYEYLASGVPVAASPLRSLEGLAGTHLDEDLVTAVNAALGGPRPDRTAALQAHSWTARVAQLGLRAPQSHDGIELKIEHRGPTHHPIGARLVP